VDVKCLHDVVGTNKGNTNPLRCGFCSIIYQQFWTWQSAQYRLKSQLWAHTLQRRVQQNGEFEPSGLSDVRDYFSQKVNQYKDVCFQDDKTFSSGSCSSKTCNVCYQDKEAQLEFGDLKQLCEPCRKVVNEQHEADNGDAKFGPVIPLLLEPTISSDGNSFSTLKVKHALSQAYIGPEGSYAWTWIMYTLPGE
jgi:hypothetical protein